jgi:hypothetical protein
LRISYGESALKLTPFAIIAAIAVCASILFAAFALVTPGSEHPASRSFNFSQMLPTVATTASNPNGCGANVTEYLSVPLGGSLRYQGTVNQSSGYVNFWLTGTNGVNSYQNIGPQGTAGGEVGSGGVAVEYTLVFQGCDSSASGVSLVFSGTF